MRSSAFAKGAILAVLEKKRAKREATLTSLEGKTALVTGGGRGIGRAIALAFADAGCTVAVSSRTRAELDAVVCEIEARGARGLAVVADAMSSESIRDAVAHVVDAFGRFDILGSQISRKRCCWTEEWSRESRR